MDYMEFRLRVPYGRWVCADGREVIFNREYWPILQRYPGEPVKAAILTSGSSSSNKNIFLMTATVRGPGVAHTALQARP